MDYLVKLRVTQVPIINMFNLKKGDRLILDKRTMLLFRNKKDAVEEKDFVTNEMFIGLGYEYCENHLYPLNR